jgi:acetyl-CoA carboxylase alpha subunit
MIGGLKNWWSIFMIVGQQKDITKKTIQKLRDGKPEGYRKRCA